jgi:hypothetical protein
MIVKKWFKNKWFRRVFFTGLGALAGFAYYYFIGCSTGTCPLTSNPYTSIIYGAVVGLVLSIDGKRKETQP